MQSGLWVGTVTVDAVDSLARPDADTPAPAGGDFSFRLIVHVGESQNARLLKQVVMLTGGGEDMALYTDLAALNAAVERRQSADPESLIETRRVSTPAFDFGPASLPMSGALAPGQSVRIDIPIRRDDPTNPFAHRAHPQHDGKNDGIAPEPDKGGGEIYEIVRRLELTPDAEPGKDDAIVNGRYSETIEGLGARPIRVSGQFQIRRVFDNADLDP